MNRIVRLSSEHDCVVRYCGDSDLELVDPNDRLIANKPIITGNELNILVWNIFKQKRVESLNVLEKFFDQNQLILLQELKTSPKLLKFIKKNNKIADHVPAYSINDVYTGVMTIANTKPISAVAFKEKEPLIRVCKSALITQYSLPNNSQTLLVANIHAVNFSFGVKIYRQQIKILLSRIYLHQGPIILAGDFNAWSRRRLYLLYNLIRKINLKSVNFSMDVRKTFMGQPLDFVFYRGLKLKRASTLNTDASDHNPLFVSFTID